METKNELSVKKCPRCKKVKNLNRFGIRRVFVNYEKVNVGNYSCKSCCREIQRNSYAKSKLVSLGIEPTKENIIKFKNSVAEKKTKCNI